MKPPFLEYERMTTNGATPSSGNTPPSPAPLAPPALTGNDSFAISLALLMIRLVLGWIFIYHGSQKLFGAFGGLMPGMNAAEGMDMFAQGLKDMPVLPAKVWAYTAAIGEFAGGVTVLL